MNERPRLILLLEQFYIARTSLSQEYCASPGRICAVSVQLDSRGYASSPDMKGRKANKLSLGKLVIYRERMQLSRCPTNAFLDELVG